METKSTKPEGSPSAASPIGPVRDSLEFQYVAALAEALDEAMETNGVQLPNKGEHWTDGHSVFAGFFPRWRKIERERVAAQAKASEWTRRLLDAGIIETALANGRTYYRLKD